MSENQSEENNREHKEKGRITRDLKRPPRLRKAREVVLTSGERKKRTDIGWEEKDEDEE
jgi:hypothetical protein